MYIEKLKLFTNETEIKNYIDTLSDMELKNLFTEIETYEKEVEQKVLVSQTKIEQINKQIQEKEQELQNLGIASYQDCDLELNKLKESISNDIIKYTSILNQYSN